MKSYPYKKGTRFLMRKKLKQFSLSFLIILLVAGPLTVIPTQTVNADSSACLAGILATKGKQLAQGVGNRIQAVPTYDAANHSANTETAGQTTGFTIQRCIVEPLVTIMARSLLDNFTAQTVNWINSGFNGSPLYVTNLQGFLADAADQAAGTFIEGLGPIGQILCGPFDFQLRISLGIAYERPGFYQYVGCRLSEIQQNVQRAFTTGIFGKNGWDNWLNLTITPQNNMYGSYLKAVDTVDARIAGTQFRLKTQLDFGKGFLSSVDPVTGKITTPGSLIEDQLSTTLGVEVQRVGLAKDIDAIIGALVGQLVNQVMGGIGGLAGAGTTNDGSGQSAVSRALESSSNQYITQANQAQNLPDGLYVNSIGPTGSGGPTGIEFCTEFRKNVYGVDTPANGSQPTLSSPVLVKVNGIADKNAVFKATQKVDPTGNNGITSWSLANYNNVVLYCKNVEITTAIKNNTNEFNDANTPYTPTPVTNSPQNNIDREINLYTAKLNQSTIAIVDGSARGPQNALGGYVYAQTLNDRDPHWWSASLNQSEDIKVVKVRWYPGYGATGALYLANLPDDKLGVPITLYDINELNKVVEFQGLKQHKGSSYTITGDEDDYIITFDTPVKANAIVLQNYRIIALYKVELYKPPVQSARSGGTTGTADTTPKTSFDLSPVSSQNFNRGDSFSNSLVLSNNQNISGLRARIKVKGLDGSSYSLYTIFDKFEITTTKKPSGASKFYSATITDLTNTQLGYDNDFALTAADTSVQIDRVGHIKGQVAGGFKYQIITEIYKAATNEVIATQTTTIGIN